MPTLVQTGNLCIEPAFLPDHQALFAALCDAIAWDERMRARKAMSFGVPYNYSGITWPPAPFPELLQPILPKVAERVSFVPNNCLAHYYPDGSSTMGFHSDAVAELDPGTGIAIVSLGGTRSITFRATTDRKRREEYPLGSGSLLIMSPEMQNHWQHAILATENAEPRISLTFRRLKSAG